MSNETPEVIAAARAAISAGHDLATEIFACLPPERKAEWSAYQSGGAGVEVVLHWTPTGVSARLGLMVEDHVSALVWERAFPKPSEH